MFEKEAIRHAFEDTIGVECLIKPVEDFTYEELSDEQQEKAYDFKKGAEFGYNKANEWHKLDWEKDVPDVDKLVRVRTKRGAEYICETYSYLPSEDEIGYGSVITQFLELNGDWVDDNEIGYWCYIEPFKESE